VVTHKEGLAVRPYALEAEASSRMRAGATVLLDRLLAPVVARMARPAVRFGA
jgi:hypothetical protein